MSRSEIHEVHVRTATERLEKARHAKVAIVLGSGLASFEAQVENRTKTFYYDLPGWPEVGVAGHGSHVSTGTVAGKRVHVLTGRTHYYEKGDAAAMAVPIETLKRCGVETLILTNAAGSQNFLILFTARCTLILFTCLKSQTFFNSTGHLGF